MKLLTFKEFVSLREGVLLPDRPPASGLPRINATPGTDAHRVRTRPRPVALPQPGRPTLPLVAQVVPPSVVAKIK